MVLFGLSILAGMLTVLAPCILPLLPVVIGASEGGGRRLSTRSLVVILSLVVSVFVFTVLLKATTTLIVIPETVWQYLSGGILVVLGLTLLFPTMLLKVPGLRTLSRKSNQVVGTGYKKTNTWGGVIIGTALGPVFSTCSPTYLFIVATALPTSWFTGLWYLFGFVLGLALVLLAIAYFGQQLISYLINYIGHVERVKYIFGIILILVGTLITTGLDKKFETWILDQGYGATIQLEESLLEAVQAPDALVYKTESMTGSAESVATATALFANGCFWCVEHDLEKVNGVITVVSGFAGGVAPNPTYDTYAANGHREVVAVTYDPTIVSYGNLVEHILKHGDPTDDEGSFYDRGVSYAPAIYYESNAEQEMAEQVIAAVAASGKLGKPVTISVVPRSTFFPAEEYHQDYAQKNPIKYNYYRAASGRTKFYESVWGNSAYTFEFSPGPEVSSVRPNAMQQTFTADSWNNFVKPSREVLRQSLSDVAYRVTQDNSTERAGTSPLDKVNEPGIFVDVVSGEPLFFAKDKYDSGTGWPSFVKPITDVVVTLHEDKKLFSTRTEVRSRYADSHLGHVFTDGPTDRGGLRYCMNGVALRFIPLGQMEEAGYAYLVEAAS
jgi:peptide methionine sulfoxide reductase msrA/msrB